MTKIYQVTAKSTKYDNELPQRVNVVAGSVTQAVSRTKKEFRSHEEIVSVELIAKADN